MRRSLKLLRALLALAPLSLSAAETTMVAGPPLTGGRMGHSVLVTPAGKVVLFGGHGPNFTTLTTADTLPAGGTAWVSSSMLNPHDAHAFARLSDGRYLLAGGSSSLGIPAYDTIELFDPGTGTFSPGGTLVRFRASSGSAQLTGGKVLLAGAWWVHNDANVVGELYDVSAGTSTATGPLNQARSAPLVFPTTDGNAVVVGGFQVTGGSIPASPELYSVADNTFTPISTELFADDPGWMIGPTGSAVGVVEDLRLADGRFFCPMYRPANGKTEQGFFTFDPQTKVFARFATTTALPDQSSEIFLYNPMIDRVHNRAYVLSYVTGSSPERALIRSVDLATGATEALPGVVQFPETYEFSSASISLLPDGRILVAGGATPGSGNFGARAETFYITPGTGGPSVGIDTYAGVTVTGSSGSSYVVEYATALVPDQWLPLTTVTLTAPSQLVIDPSPLSGQTKRFYRARPAN